MKNLLLVALFCGYLSVVSCRKTPVGNGPDQNSVEFLRNSPEKIPLDSFTLVLETFVWRDFMPGGSDSRMRSKIRLKDQGQKDLRPRFELVGQTVLHGKQKWETVFDTAKATHVPALLENMSSQGPKWMTGDTVDVVCHFKDKVSGLNYNIIRKKDIIGKTG